MGHGHANLSFNISEIIGVDAAHDSWQALVRCKICLRLPPLLTEISVAALVDQLAHILSMAAGPDSRLVHVCGWIAQEVRLHRDMPSIL